MFELYLIFVINKLNFNQIINFLLILFYKLFFEFILFIITLHAFHTKYTPIKSIIFRFEKNFKQYFNANKMCFKSLFSILSMLSIAFEVSHKNRERKKIV